MNFIFETQFRFVASLTLNSSLSCLSGSSAAITIVSTTPGKVFASKWGPCQTEAHTENFAEENIFIVILGKGGEWQRSGKKIDLELIDIIERSYKALWGLMFFTLFYVWL